MEQAQIDQQKVQYIWCSATITKKMEDVFTAFINNQAQAGQKISEYVFLH